MAKDVMIVKRNGNLEKFDPERVKKAVTSSAERVMVDLTEEALDKIGKVSMDNIKEFFETGNCENFVK